MVVAMGGVGALGSDQGLADYCVRYRTVVLFRRAWLHVYGLLGVA